MGKTVFHMLCMLWAASWPSDGILWNADLGGNEYTEGSDFVQLASALQQSYSGIQAGFMQPTGAFFSQARGAPSIGLYGGLSGPRVDYMLGAQSGLFSVAREPIALGSGTLGQGGAPFL